MRLRKIDSLEDYYYKCLFASVWRTRSVMDANAKAREIFQVNNNHYEPHLSLVYGFFPPEKKEKIIQQIGKFDYSFKVDELSLLSTAGGVLNWYELGRFPLE